MRTWWIASLLLLWTGSLLAQISGMVESIGFDSYYRPDCWVPMAVQLTNASGSAAELQIRVIQEDLDRDRVVAIRNITLSPDISNTGEPQRFWMYFRPQASKGGLADASVGGSPSDLAHQLKVVVTTRGGSTVATLPNTQQNLKRVEVGSNAMPTDVVPQRVVLCVSDGGVTPSGREYEQVDGISAMPLFLSARPRDLPEDVRGFEMVDAILWLGATAPDPRRSLEEPRYRALEQYVRQGGLLVVCQSTESMKLRGFDDILPVRNIQLRDSDDLAPLPMMGGLDWSNPPETASQPRRVAVASVVPGSVVVRTKQIDSESHPYLVRRAIGTGCVTWVAQDLGEPALVRALGGGWVRIWDEILGWRSTPTRRVEDRMTAYSDRLGVVDIGRSFDSGGSLSLTASGYVLVAVVFFAVYWVAAGPGLYAYLRSRDRSSLNWYLFSVMAIVAAALALVVVRIAHSRSPSLEHVTMIRATPGEYATVQSRIGLYVPATENKEVRITDTAPQTTNWITPFPEHPARHSGSSQFLAMKQYEMPIVDATSDEPVSISVPWRSTMKKLQVRWNGELSAAIVGNVAISGQARPELRGTLANGTPWDLREIYLAYRIPITGDGPNAGGDRVIYIPTWEKGKSIDIGQLLLSDRAFPIGADARSQALPGRGFVVYGGIERIHGVGEGWAKFLYSQETPGSGVFGLSLIDDSSRGYRVSLPLASLFDRIPPMSNEMSANGYRATRRDFARIGARFLNVSPSVAAGRLVVIAQAHGPLPIPLTVDGETPEGEGVIFYQCVLPLGGAERENLEKQ